MWDRAPNFLLVDYYNRGSPEAGSVFHVAAAANGVTYTTDCCGKVESAAPSFRNSFSGVTWVAVFFATMVTAAAAANSAATGIWVW
jgi:hypothetical protein